MLFARHLLIAGAAAALAVSAAQAEALSIESGKSVPVRLSGSAASVVLGNKNIADVSVHDENLIFVTGKSHGTTNLMVFDRDGRQIYTNDVVVTTIVSGLVTVSRAGAVNTLDCTPSCRAVISPGDESTYFDVLMKQQQEMKSLTDD
jgi:Flp pilus assembly secretin CpaC